jgi:RNA polymerase sigma-70 factor (ECF subfamily)
MALHPGGRFATTRWSVVALAGHASDSGATHALEQLCQAYWPPLYGYLRGRGHGPEDAQDLTQGFFARMLETGGISTADPARGRFRSFLLTALKRYAINEHARGVAARRGGGQVHLTLDFESAEHAYASERRDDESPERVFDRKWATLVLDRALQRLRDDYDQAGKGVLAQALLPYLTETGDMPAYRAIAGELRVSEGAVKVAVHRLRQRYGAILRLEIGETVTGPGEVEAEMRELLRAVST